MAREPSGAPLSRPAARAPHPRKLSHTSPRSCAAQTLTKAALSMYKGSALEASSNSPGSRQADSELISLLGAQLRRQPKAESCQMIINVAQLLSRTPSNRPSLLLALPQVVGSMHRHVEHEGLQECVLGLFGNLACGPAEEQRALLRAGTLQHAVRCLQCHVESPGVQRNAYRFLRNATSTLAVLDSRNGGGGEEEATQAVDELLASECVDVLLAQRVPQLVAFVLHRHIDNATVLEQALAALWSFSCAPPLARLLSESAAADGVVRAMGRHPTSPGVQRCGCGALAQMLVTCGGGSRDSRGSPPPGVPASGPGGGGGAAAATAAARAWTAARPMPAPAELAPPVLVAAHAHPDDPSILIEAMEALGALARSSRAPPLQQAQLLDALRVGASALSSAKRLASQPSVVLSVCGLLEAAIPSPESAHAPLVHAEAETMLPQLLRAVDEHADDADVAAAACSLLAKLCGAAGALTPALVRAGALPTTICLLQRCPAEEDVAPNAVHVLRCLLSFSPHSATAAFLLADGLPTVMGAMAVHRTRHDVQEAACAVLWSCAMHCKAARVHPHLHPASAELQRALLPLGPAALAHALAHGTRAGLARVHRALSGLLWALSHRGPHARSLCSPEWVELMASAAESRVREPRVRESLCGIAANILALSETSGADARSATASPSTECTVISKSGGSLVRLSPEAAVCRLPAIALATGGLFFSRAGLHPGARRAASALLRRVATFRGLIRPLLHSDAPALLYAALAEPSSLLPEEEGEDSADDDDDVLSRDAAAALHALLAPLASRLLLARAIDGGVDGGMGRMSDGSNDQPDASRRLDTPMPATLTALLHALALARPWLPSEQLEHADGCCVQLPLPLALGVCHAPPSTYQDWRGVVGGFPAGATGAAPSAILGSCAGTAAPIAIDDEAPPSAAFGPTDQATKCGSEQGVASLLESMLAEELLQLILAHACADARALVACAGTCAKWRSLVRASPVAARLDLSAHADELASGAVSLPVLCALSRHGPRAMSFSGLGRAATALGLEAARTHGAQLRVLDLSMCALGSPAFLRGIAYTCEHLQVLDLTDCAAAVDDAALASVAARCSDMRVLSLNSCVRAGDDGLAALASGCRQLRALHLFGCPAAGPRGIAAIATGCPHLVCVDLTCSGAASDAAVGVLARSGLALRAVGAGCAASLTDETVCDLAAACRASLEHVFLPTCPRLTAASAAALQACPRLRCALLLASCDAVPLVVSRGHDGAGGYP